MEGEIPTWALKELHWELLPPEPTVSPLIAFVTLLLCMLTIDMYINDPLLCFVFQIALAWEKLTYKAKVSTEESLDFSPGV